jgi:hypothetical protein
MTFADSFPGLSTMADAVDELEAYERMTEAQGTNPNDRIDF